MKRLAIAWMGLSLSLPAHASRVGIGGAPCAFDTLQEAFDHIDAVGLPGTVIVYASAGTYPEHLVIDHGGITWDQIHVYPAEADCSAISTDELVIDAEGLGHALLLRMTHTQTSSGAAVTFHHTKFEGGANDSGDSGGAVVVEAGGLVLTDDSTIEDSDANGAAGKGGCLQASEGAWVRLEGEVGLEDCNASGFGGAIAALGELTLVELSADVEGDLLVTNSLAGAAGGAL
jgi:hypothetical protein